MIPKYGWAACEDAEDWSEAEGDTFEEAARFALAEEPDNGEVWICECKPVSGLDALMDALDAEEVIERAEECRENRPEDSAGWYEDRLFDHSGEAATCLQQMLRDAAEDWLRQYPGAAARIWEASNPKPAHREDYGSPESA